MPCSDASLAKRLSTRNTMQPSAESRDAISDALETAWPADRWSGVNVLVAVSGGADSVALLRAMVEAKRAVAGAGELFAAHFNHRLRGDASDADEAWVRRLSESLEVRLECGRAAGEGRDSEEAARDDRYAFLTEAAGRLGARFVATAHTRDDQVETLLFRLFRGTGLAGFAGIRPARELTPAVSLVRPLLAVSRDQIEAFLAARQQDYRTDASNADPRYTRNWVRHTLLPTVTERFGPSAYDAALGLSQQAAEAQAVIEELAVSVAARSAASDATTGDDRVVIAPADLVSAPSIVAREACKHLWRRAAWPEQAMGLDEWRRLADFVADSSSPPPIMLPGGVRASWEGSVVVLSRSC